MSAAVDGRRLLGVALLGAALSCSSLLAAPASAAEGKVSIASMTPSQAALARPLLKFGESTNPAVRYVQVRFGIKPATGVFGPRTLATVKAFQTWRGIPATGNIGPMTWKAILATNNLIKVPQLGTPASPSAGPSSGLPAAPPAGSASTVIPSFTAQLAAAQGRPVLRPGTGPNHPAVMYVQRKLGVATTGFYGSVTTSAVLTYQQRMGIPGTGNVGPLTWQAIFTGRAPGGSTGGSTGGSSSGTSGSSTSSPAWSTGRPNPPVLPGDSPQTTVIKFALAQVGEQYILGGVGPDVWDCSGLVQVAYARAGISVPRVASAQYAASRRVDISEIRPGDLLFYTTVPGQITHVVIYTGGGRTVEAANPRRGVMTSVVSSPWFMKHYVGAGRVVG